MFAHPFQSGVKRKRGCTASGHHRMATAILTNVQDKTAAILANFGANDGAVIDVVLGNAKAKGHLPFELPSSMKAVGTQDPAVPGDSLHPLFKRGFGIVP
jgi:beta-glucosidase